MSDTSSSSEVMSSVINMLLINLPFILLCLLSLKINLRKVNRSKQFPMPVIALVYSVVVYIFSNKFNTFLIKKIYEYTEKIQTGQGLEKLPAGLRQFISGISPQIVEYIKSLNLNFWIFFITNTLIMALYLIIKGISLLALRKVSQESEAFRSVSGNFYEYHDEKNVWTVKNSLVQARTLLKVFYFTALIISVILMMVSRKFFLDELLRTVFYPVFSVILVGEVYFYLDGISWNEYKTVIGEADDAEKRANYALLKRFLKKLFGDKLLAENTVTNNGLASPLTNDEIINGLEKEDDQVINTFAAYLRRVSSGGMQMDCNYVSSAVELLRGNSVLFNNPFYNDLIPYAFYPMNRELLKHNKVLVLLGRHAIEDDIIDWIERGIGKVTNIPYLWNIGILNGESTDADIGIITRSDMLRSDIIESNAAFLSKVTYCVIIEPSKLLPTSQIGLEFIIRRCKDRENDNVTFCLCDKNCDGLVDALSHALATNLTEVAATNKHKGTSSYMCWDSDDEHLHHRMFPNISRYLGSGTELSFAALKNQVSKTRWFGGETFPVADINWIDRQYYYELNKYAGLPISQESFNDRFETTANFWSAGISDNNYFVVEDEAFNMFEILRNFSTRSKDQGFINVISSDYMLKDYMAVNSPIFETDPKAIPYFSADYARTERNTALRLVLQISSGPVRKQVVEKELDLLGIEIYDVHRQLWYEIFKCYTGVSQLSTLSDDYREAVDEAWIRSISLNGSEVGREILELNESYSVKSGRVESFFTITDRVFINKFLASLRSAGYIAEDEKGDINYIGAELCGHIYQKLLPGQFFTFGGKYYEMQYLTSDGKVLVRRAADHIDGRKSYRQIRNYNITASAPSRRIGSVINISGLKVSKEFADFTVETPGYFCLDRYNDFETARRVVFEGESDKVPVRSYRNKQILRIDFPGGDSFTDEIRYTITMLMNEVFRTLYAENQQYISALTDLSYLEENKGYPLTFTLTGEEINPKSIYIIEDSELDLGILISVERNLMRILKIVDDYLDWHFEAMETMGVPQPDPEPYYPEKQEEPEKKGFFRRIIDWFRKKFGKGKDKKEKKRRKKGGPDGDGQPQDAQAPAGGDAFTPDPGQPVVNNLHGISGSLQGITPDPDNAPLQAGNDFEASFVDLPDGTIKDIDPDTPIEPDLSNGEPMFSIAPGGYDEPEEADGETEADVPEENAAAAEENVPESVDSVADVPADKADTEDITNEPDTPVTENTDAPAVASAPENGDASADKADTEDITNEPDTPVTENTDAPAVVSAPENGDAPVDAAAEPTEDGEPAEEEKKPEQRLRKPYQESYFLLFGGKEMPAEINIRSTLDFLNGMGLDRNELRQVREARKKDLAKTEEYVPNKAGSRYCDFCGAEIYGVEFESLADGRERCITCSNSSVKTPEEFKKIYNDVKRNLESFFGIKINVGIRVEMVNSKKLHKKLGESFVPTKKFDPRTLGVAIKDKNGYTILVENGAPRMQTTLTLAHEMTHIWQYNNWNRKEINRKFGGKKGALEIYEGMAKWVEIQYAYLINEPVTARREEIITSDRNDEYGRGFLRYREVYPFSTGTVVTKPTPFNNVKDPLVPQ